MRLDRLAEQRILAAKAEGKLDGLKSEGAPLPETGAETADAAGFRIMAEAGALPEEIRLRKAIDAASRTRCGGG